MFLLLKDSTLKVSFILSNSMLKFDIHCHNFQNSGFSSGSSLSLRHAILAALKL